MMIHPRVESVNIPRKASRKVYRKRVKPGSVLALLLSAILLTQCAPERLDDLNDISMDLVNQRGETVHFPTDFQGKPVMIGFIYTYCPDICSFITANLYQTWQELDETEDAHFLLITFDPKRDTPEALASYSRAFNMDREPFQFLTGDPDEIEALMERLGVRTQVSYTTEIEPGEEVYFLNHTDKVLLLDESSRMVMDYGGSMTPVHIFKTDLADLL